MKIFLLLCQVLFLFRYGHGLALGDMFKSNSVETDYQGQRVSQQGPAHNAGMPSGNPNGNRMQYNHQRQRGEGVFDDRSRISAMSRAHSRQIGMNNMMGGLRGGGGAGQGINVGGGNIRSKMARMAGAGGSGRFSDGNANNLISRMQNAVGGVVDNGENNNDEIIDKKYQLNEEKSLAYQNQLRNYIQQRNKMQGIRGTSGMGNVNSILNKNYNLNDNNPGGIARNSLNFASRLQNGNRAISQQNMQENEGGFDAAAAGGAGGAQGSAIQEQVNNKMNDIRGMEDEFNQKIQDSKIDGKYYMNPVQMKQARLAAKQYKNIQQKEDETGIPNFGFAKYHGVGGMRANHLRPQSDLEHREQAAQKLKQMMQEKN